jgi:hypothetical protein
MQHHPDITVHVAAIDHAVDEVRVGRGGLR